MMAIKDIKMIVMDVDGVLTDGRIIVSSDDELKFFDVRDGLGILMARKVGIKTGIITGLKSKVVERRAKNLKIDYLVQDCTKKEKALTDMAKKAGMSMKNVCYIGDDIYDIPALRIAGFSATVADAPDYIKKETAYIASKPGGRGAVREIIEHILKARGLMEKAIEGMIDD